MNEFIENWAELEFSDVVRLYRKGELLATGIVDGVMPDGSAVWLIQGTFFGRALFLKSDGANAVRVAREDLPTGYIISTKKQGLTWPFRIRDRDASAPLRPSGVS